jgi:hypothetical protein
VPAFKGPERRNIYRALHQKEDKAQIRLNQGRGTLSAKSLIGHHVGGTGARRMRSIQSKIV